MQYDRVVITGMGAITPLGNTVADYWQNLVAGVSGSDKITKFDSSNSKRSLRVRSRI
jgi:3-oxoacyl-[acyl-carrier-protein] synthase II